MTTVFLTHAIMELHVLKPKLITIATVRLALRAKIVPMQSQNARIHLVMVWYKFIANCVIISLLSFVNMEKKLIINGFVYPFDWQLATCLTVVWARPMVLLPLKYAVTMGSVLPSRMDRSDVPVTLDTQENCAMKVRFCQLRIVKKSYLSRMYYWDVSF